MNHGNSLIFHFKRVVASLIDLSIFLISFMFVWILVVEPIFNNTTDIAATRETFEQKGLEFGIYIKDEKGVILEVTPANSSLTQAEIDELIKKFNENEEVMALSNKLSKYMLTQAVVSSILPALVFYGVAPFFLNGQTLAKKALGIGIKSLDGNKLNKKQIVLRQIAFVVIEIYLGVLSAGLVPLISLAFVFFSKKNISLHDFVSSTKAVPYKLLLEETINDEEDDYYRRIAEEDARANARDLTIGGKK